MKASSLVAVGILFAASGYAARAAACGGCFHEPTTLSSSADTLVTGHRMAFAISQNRTVLWDQIKFSGSPTEFGWVLPVKPGAYIEESTDAWFEALESVTAVRVSSPQVTCPPPPVSSFSGGSSGSGCGCGASASGDSAPLNNGQGFPVNDASFTPPPPPVTVVHEGTVGAFETVTLSSNDGSALRTWLSDHAYGVPPEIEPVIDTYVSEGADFIALRLVPGAGVNQMTPVRVITPSGDPILPLRMVAAGTGAFTDIVLYVIGEGRNDLKDLTEAKVKLGELSFDFAKDDSNYSKLRETALGENNGFSFITAFSSLGAFSRSFSDPFGVTVSFADTSSNSHADFTSLYFAQANLNDGRSPVSGAACAQSVLGRFASSEFVEATPGDGGLTPLPVDGGVRDGGSRADVGGRTVVGPIALDYVCNGHDDIAAALTGMQPNRVWLTRLEMNLPREALSMDCNVGLAGSQVFVDSQIRAPRASNLPCSGAVITGGVAQSFANSTSTCVWAIGSFLSLVVARRHQKRQRGFRRPS